MKIPAASVVSDRGTFSSRQSMTSNQHDATLNKAEGSRAQNAEGPPARTKGRCVKNASGTPPTMTSGTQRIMDATDAEVVPVNWMTSSSQSGRMVKAAKTTKP
jgi:hypothetical protein